MLDLMVKGQKATRLRLMRELDWMCRCSEYGCARQLLVCMLTDSFSLYVLARAQDYAESQQSSKAIREQSETKQAF